jgi:heme-degrading monooxygenase HmoA
VFIVIYRWRLKEGRESVFRQGWCEMTGSIYIMRGSLGSRLHRSEDGTWVAYAQWPDEETWRKAREGGTANEAAALKMREGSAELLSEEHLHVIDDLLCAGPYNEQDASPRS